MRVSFSSFPSLPLVLLPGRPQSDVNYDVFEDAVAALYRWCVWEKEIEIGEIVMWGVI